LSSYPDGKSAVVTIMLFSAIIVAIELPHLGTRRSLRYRQMLGRGNARSSSTLSRTRSHAGA
jgi:hypothetical protein